MAGEHEGDVPEATEATMEPAIPVEAHEVTYAQTEGGDVVTGYFARPQRADSVLEARNRDPNTHSLPGIVVIHEWWGLNENIRAATRRLAGQGYQALAVDLYNGATAEDPDAAQSLMQQALEEEPRLISNVQDAEEYLRSEVDASTVAVLGWCFGGGMTFRSVANMPTHFDAAVVYYGSPDALTESTIEPIAAPILGHFGLEDNAVPIKDVRGVEAKLEELGKDVQFYEYEAGHAFANPSGTNYDPDAAETAWARTTDFLDTHLYPEASGQEAEMED